MWISLDQTDSKNWFESNLISLNFPQNFRSVVIKITWGWNVLNAEINVIFNADDPDDPDDVGWHVLQYLIWSIWSFRQMIRMTWDQYDHWGRLSGFGMSWDQCDSSGRWSEWHGAMSATWSRSTPAWSSWWGGTPASRYSSPWSRRAESSCSTNP